MIKDSVQLQVKYVIIQPRLHLKLGVLLFGVQINPTTTQTAPKQVPVVAKDHSNESELHDGIMPSLGRIRGQKTHFPFAISILAAPPAPPLNNRRG